MRGQRETQLRFQERIVVGILVLVLLLGNHPGFGEESLEGFSRESARRQREIERYFYGLPSVEELRRQHRLFTAEPHPAGSERNNELARYIAEKWKEYGWEEVTLHRYDVLISSPREVVVEMVHPKSFRASLREDPYPEDPDTWNPRVRGAYLALSASGEVTAPLIYAHSGNPEDYELLRKQGLDVRGKIVLVRYSRPYSYRGFKAYTAEREGAAAILIYSDPAEDGYVQGEVFPKGPWGPESHIQRGAITYDFLIPGDPLTPGWASVPGARRIPMEQAISVPRIIAVPLSWRDAQPLLENLDGPPAPKSWQGGLPLTYRLGGQTVHVRVRVEMETDIKPIYVVEGRILGAEFPDEWIVLGNHRDAWEFGGVDPSSGTAAMMELARALGELKKRGMRPRRTIVLCSWDGEEVALTGSTEWGEQFADEVRSKVVAYINVDSAVSGPNLQVAAVPSLAPLVLSLARTLRAPSGRTLLQAWRLSERTGRSRGAHLVNMRIGSGSDHTVFLNHLGVPVSDLSFTGPYGVYHSMYDGFYWMNRFGDPGYRYHRLMVQLWGAMALRLANADILPFDFVIYADQLRHFVEEVRRAHGALGVSWPSLLDHIREFRAVAEQWQRARAWALEWAPREWCARINRQLCQVERNWTHPAGLPGRPWFKHLIYGTRYTYASLELPGITEALERRDLQEAREQVRLLQEAVAKNAALLRALVQEAEALRKRSSGKTSASLRR